MNLVRISGDPNINPYCRDTQQGTGIAHVGETVGQWSASPAVQSIDIKPEV